MVKKKLSGPNQAFFLLSFQSLFPFSLSKLQKSLLTEDKACVNMEQSVPTLCTLVISERMSTFAHDFAFLYSKITFFGLQNDAICL